MSPLAFLCSLVSALATLGIGVSVVRAICSKTLPLALLLGSGYGVGMVVTGTLVMWLSSQGVSLTASSWAVICLGFLSGSVVLFNTGILGTLVSQGSRISSQSAGKLIGLCTWNPICLFFLALIAVHFTISAASNLTLPLFPWDAITTWIYRAKAWVLQDAVAQMVSVPVWLESNGIEGFAIKAASYRGTVSSYAAFLSATTGDWNWPTVSLSWSFAFLAICSALFGTLQLAGSGTQKALLGTYLISSLPILNVHASLSGYADIWTALLSGIGLALLLVWRLINSHQVIALSLLLLVAGSTLKNEGMLWLLLALLFIAFEVSRLRFGLGKTLALGVLTGGLIYALGITEIEVPFLGLFGVTDTRISGGWLGSYDLRPYNPLPSLNNALFNQATFLLLPVIYGFSLLFVKWLKPQIAVPLHALNVLLAGSFLIIFGLSSFSRFAEIGTAMNRVLMQITPALVIAVGLVFSGLFRKEEAKSLKRPVGKPALTKFLPVFLISASLALLFFLSVALEHFSPSGDDVDLSARELVPVAGSVEYTGAVVQLTDSPISVGVLKAPVPQNSGHKPKYLIYDISFDKEGDVSLYWIKKGETAVQRYSLTHPGVYIQSLAAMNLSETALSEVGLLVRKQAFATTQVRRFHLKDQISWKDWRAIASSWSQPAAISQTTANFTIGHIATPIRAATWVTHLTLTVILIGLLGYYISRSHVFLRALCASVIAIWIASDLLFVKNSGVLSTLSIGLPSSPPSGMEHTDQWGRYAPKLASKIREVAPKNLPIIIAPTSYLTVFLSNMLAYELLPERAVTLPASRIKRIPENWPGVIVVVGTSTEESMKLAAGISKNTGAKMVSDLGAYKILYAD